MNAGYQRSTLDINRVNEVNGISVGLSVHSVQRQAQAFNAKQVALNAGTIDQVKEIKKISVEVSVRSVQRQAQAFNARQVALNAGSQSRNLAKSESPEKFPESSVDERGKQRSTLNYYNNGQNLNSVEAALV